MNQAHRALHRVGSPARWLAHRPTPVATRPASPRIFVNPAWFSAQAKEAAEAKAKRLDQRVLDEQEQEVRTRQGQVKRPWHRQGADDPPVTDKEFAEPVTEGIWHLIFAVFAC